MIKFLKHITLGLLVFLFWQKTPVLAINQTVIACLGDSITYGAGAPANKSYPSQLQSLLGSSYKVINRGQSGWTADQVLANTDAWLAQDKPDIVIIMLGVNDMRKNQKPAAVRQEIQNIVNKAKAYGAKVILSAVTPNLGDPKCDTLCMKPLVDELRLNIAREDYYTQNPWAGLLLDAGDYAKGGNPILFGDALHPNASGYKRIALSFEATVKIVNNCLDCLTPTPTPNPNTASCYEDNDVQITWDGNWFTGTHENASNGSWRFTNQTGNRSCVNFSGSWLDWYTVAYKNRGTAKVYLDSQLIDTVNNYSPAMQWQVLKHYSFSQASHIFCVEVVGNGYVDVDKFCLADSVIVTPTPTSIPTATPTPTDDVSAEVCYENTAEQVDFSGNWLLGTLDQASGGSWRFTNTAGSKACLPFTGSSVDWYTITFKNRGTSEVYLDGKLIDTISNYSTTMQWQVIRHYNFSDIAHTFCLEAVGDGILDVDKICFRN
ncbi:MAG: GDSL-type esterase/lipase family protein [Candidatus Shapirobacteria bacterium]